MASPLATASRCPSGDAVCARVAKMEPYLPIRPQFKPEYPNNPCFDEGPGGKTICLPFVHVISGWHMFSDEALAWLKSEPQLETRSGQCFDDWGDDDKGASTWIKSFGKPPTSPNNLLLTHCNKLLTWYPAFAGRYTSAWGKAYGPCKTHEVATCAKEGCDYYNAKMWQVCRPDSLKAHDAAMGTGGAGKEATPPFVMKALYGSRVRVISALRNPVDRLETSFWAHRHYPGKYGSNPQGFQRYLDEQGRAFENCAAKHTARRCAYLFELIDAEYGEVFFHCDQIIRGLYEPFVRDWHAALGADSLLVLRVEALLDEPAASRAKVARFLGLAPDSKSAKAMEAGATVATSYRELHAQSLHEARAQPMLNSTRAAAEAFYRPYNDALALLLGWKKAEAWPHSTAIDAAGIASAVPPTGKGGRSKRRAMREQRRGRQ